MRPYIPFVGDEVTCTHTDLVSMGKGRIIHVFTESSHALQIARNVTSAPYPEQCVVAFHNTNYTLQCIATEFLCPTTQHENV